MRIVVETADGLNLVETAVEKSGVQEIRHTIILTKVICTQNSGHIFMN